LALEPNAVAQEAGLAAIIEYVSNAPNASSTRETVITALVEKCLGATKAGTKQKATDIILLYAEIDTPEPVLEFVIPGTNAKQPKLVTQTVTVLKELVRQFGIKKVNPKPILKLVPKLFTHADKNVRAEVSALTIELYRWIGPPMMASLSTTLKPVQIKELEEAFSKLPAQKPVPERLIRSEQAIEEEEEDDEPVHDDDDMDVEDVDAFDFADPVDITAKLSSNFYELLASKKWQERREALDALLAQAKTPKIMDKDYSELMAALVKRLNDANMLLVGVTANCIETIATGLRTDFSKYKPMIAPVMTEKLKERKPAILEHLVNGLNAVFASTPMSEMIEDITVASKHKNPQVRSETFKLLSRRLKEVKEIPGKAEIKTFAEMFKKLLDDADANAREAGAEGLGTLMKLIGEKPMLAFTDGLDDIKMGKIKEAFEKAVVKAKPAKKAPPPPPVKKAPVKKVVAKPKPAAAAPKPTPMAIDDDDDSFGAAALSPPKRKPPARLSGASSMKKPTLSSAKPKPAAAPASGGPKKSAKLPPSSGPEEIKYKFAQEDAESRATEFIPEAIHTDLQQAQWKLRLAAMESLVAHLESEDGNDLEPEIIIRCFSKKPGWKEMNFQVMGKMFYAIQVLSEQCPKFNKACAALCIPVMVEKLGDIKLKKPASECLVAIAEKISLQFVFAQAYAVLKKAKSPKVLADSLLWIHSCLMDFGISGLQIRDLIELLKFGLTNTNASVRTSAVTVLGALRQYIGPEVKSFVEDVSPALLATIESEFEKVSKMDPPQPTKGNAVAMVNDGDEDVGASNSASADAMESLFPRVDISNQLAKTVAECGDANWKIRKQGLDAVMAVIAGANNRIKPSLGADFPGVLKQRLNDSNKNLMSNAVEITGLLALAMGKPFEKYVKPFTGPVMAVLSDNKTTVRQAGVAALENIRKTCSMEMMVSALGTSLANESPALRKELLTWFGTAIKDEPEANKFDFSSVISPMFSCLQDRNPDVRKAAQVCLPELIAVAGYDAVASKTSELKAAQRQAVMPLVEAARGSSGGSSSSAQQQQLPRKATETKQRAEMVAADDKPPSRMKALTKKKIGIPTPRSSQAMSAANAAGATTEESKPPIITSDPRAKQVRAKKENRWQFDTPRSDVIDADEMEVDELPSISSLPRLGGRSQIGKPRASIVNPQRTIHHVQPISEPEPMEDVIDDYGHRLPEPHHVQQQMQPPPQMQHHQQQQQFASEEDVVDYLIAQITSGDPQPSIDALKNLDKYLSQNPQAVLPDIERLINAITLQVKLAYSSVDPRQPATTRLCKHLVNALVLLFSNRDLACAVPQDALHHLLQELAHRLLDQKMLSLESGPQLSKALNVAMVKVLENSSRNATFSALLSILGTCSAGLRPGDLTSAKDTKYTELIMKCLWKLAKTIQENLRSNFLNPDELLYEINRFFINTPPSEWKRRATESVPLGEMPLRTVKTLLLELVNGLGDSIFQHLTLIDDPQRSSVYPYLHHMLEACRKKDRQQLQQQQPPQLQQPQQPQQPQQQHIIKPQHSPVMPVQPLQQQQQQQQQMDDTNRYLSHSRNSSLSRPASVSSFKSNNMMRSPSMASYPSADGDQTIAAIDSIPATNQSPRLSSPSLNHSQVQPMQIDEAPPQEMINKGPPILTDYDLNTTLTKIFHKIGTRDQTKQGIIELYQFQKSYPLAETKVNTYLSQTGNYFQSYIRRGLSNLAAEDSDLHAAQAAAVAAAAAQQQQTLAASSMVSQNMDYQTTPIPEQYSIHQDQRTSFESPQLSRASLHAGGKKCELKKKRVFFFSFCINTMIYR
ncbi:armadillo-type protein, partial [Helicostylum pulchrum]